MADPGPSWLGRRLEVTVGAVAHGGHCVARFDRRVLFVRHCLPGEQVLVEVTEDRGGSFCRADAVEVLVESPDRVTPPCRYAHPGGCGGCDFQHVSLPGQRALKAAVVMEQLSRLAGIERPVEVVPLPLAADVDDGLGWRRRIRYAVGPGGDLGLRAHRSHRVIGIDACPIGAPGVGDAAVLGERWPGHSEIEVAVDDRAAVAVLGIVAARPSGPARRPPKNPRDRRRPPMTVHEEQLSGPAQLTYEVRGRTFRIAPGGFWQTHPAAARVFTETVLAAAGLRPGDQALDLYAGSGLFTAALGDAVGPDGRVLGLESSAAAVAAAAENLADLDHADVRRAPVTPDSVTGAVGELQGKLGTVVLDPPRTGAGAAVIQSILAAGARSIVYVACDPAALARDLRTALDAGWELAELSAFDAFPMTQHIECIAVLRPGR